MKYIHIKNLNKYHPGYKDRTLQWAKIYFKMVQGDPDCELIENEIDWGRLIKFILLELEAQKPIPINERYLTKKGFNLKKRPISLTINMLHNFIEVIHGDVDMPTDTRHVDKDKDKEEEKKENKIQYIKYVYLYEEEYSLLTDKFGKKNTSLYVETLNDYIGSTGKKYKSHFYTLRNWLNRDLKVGKITLPEPKEEKKEEARPPVTEEDEKKVRKLIEDISKDKEGG